MYLDGFVEDFIEKKQEKRYAGPWDEFVINRGKLTNTEIKLTFDKEMFSCFASPNLKKKKEKSILKRTNL